MIHGLEKEIEATKPHWSQLDANSTRDDHEMETNQEIFAKLQKNNQFIRLFGYPFLNLKRGQKIVEGGQAEIFEGEFEKENGNKVPCVVKLFRSTFNLRHLKYECRLEC